MPTDNRKLITAIAQRVDVTRYLSYREFLGALYLNVKEEVARYSYLKFADDLGFSQTNVMRLVIVGRRPLTVKSSQKIAKALGLHGDQKKYWSTLIRYHNAKTIADKELLFTKLLTYRSRSAPTLLDPRQKEYFSEWFHPVIREITALPDFRADPEWIQTRLAFPLRLDQIKKSLALLESIGFIHFDRKKGRLTRTEENVATAAEIDSLAIIRYHQKMMAVASESLTKIDEGQRDIRAATISLPKEALGALKAKMEQWITEVAEMELNTSDDASAKEVYQLNMQLFPFTNKE